MKLSEEEKRVWDVIATWVTIVFAVIAGGFTGCQYLESKKKERVERSLAYATRYSEAYLLERRLFLQHAWEKKKSEVIRLLTASKPQPQINRDYRRFVSNFVVSDQKIEGAVITLIEFFGSVATCVDQKLCEDETVKAVFEKDGGAFFRQYSPYVCELRATWRDNEIASRMEKYFNPKAVGKACS